MKKIFFAILLGAIACVNPAFAQFTAGQTLTATALNNALAAKTSNAAAIITGGTITGLSAPIPVASGGTGANSASAALTSLGAAPLIAPVFTSNASITSPGTTNLIIISPSGNAKQVLFQTGSSVRWAIASNGTAESGGNSGSDFGAFRFSDAGAYIDNPFTIYRATGIAAFTQRPTFAGNTPYDTGNLTIANYAPLASPSFIGPVTRTGQEVDKSYTLSTPTTGTTVTIASGSQTAVIAPAGTLAALTVALPSCTAGYDGSLVRYSTSQTITALTVSSASSTVSNAPSTLAAGAGNQYICRGAATTWYRLY